MATQLIKFYKGAYENPLTLSTNNQGGIYFDTNTKQIYVGGVAYGGAITDATFADNKLTITKVGTNPIVLDFSDTASASATMQVFNQLTDYIGVADGHIGTALDYTNTNYLTTSTNLVGADRVLDTQIKSVNDRIDGLNVSNVDTVDIVTDEDGNKTFTFNGVSQTNGLIEVGTVREDVTLKKVAFTGNAADVAIADAGSVIVATNVEDALQELANQITAGDVSIDGYKGAFTTDSNSFETISTNSKKLEVKLNENGYITKDANGLNLQHVDTTGESTVGTDIATVNTVTAYIGSEIADLDVTEYAQAEIASNRESFSVYGIKEVDGKIDKGTNAVTLNFGSVYNASSNKIALVSNITDVIEGLDTDNDVQPVVYTAADANNGAKLTFKGVSETDGVIAQGAGTTELTFAKVATTGKAEDITFTTGDYIGSNLEQAVNDMDTRIESLEALPTYDVVVIGTDELPTASAATMHKIYLKSENLTSTGDIYGEYITVRSGSDPDYSYSWEKLGTTAASLDGYVKTIVVNGKSYTVDGGGSSTTVTLHDAITSITDGDGAITTDTAYTDAYIDTEVTVISTKDTTNGTYEAQVTSAAKVKIQAISTADSSHMGLAEASDVKAYIGTRVQDLNVNETSVTGTNVSFKYKETNGLVEIGTLQVDYATVQVSTTAEPSLSVTDGTKLAVGSDIAKVKEYVDAKISTVVAGLDADVTSDDAAVATVEVKEVDGVITDVVVTNINAGVAYTPAGQGTDANLTFSTETGAVTGNDITAIKNYIDAKAASSAAVVDTLSTVAVNSGDQTKIASVGGQDIHTAVSFTWEEYE